MKTKAVPAVTPQPKSKTADPFLQSGSSPGASAVPPIIPAEILTIEEVAQRLKVKPRWVYEKTRQRCQDPLPCTRIGRYLRFYWPEISAWFQRHSNTVEKREGRVA